MGVLSPDTLFVKLKWYDETRATTSQTITRTLSAMGLFDPDVNGVNQQPIGFDKYAALYQNYQVLACSIRVVAVNLAVIPARIMIYPSFTETPTNNIDTIMGNPYSRKKIGAAVTGGPSTIKISNFMTTRKFFGRSLNDLNYQAIVSTNPVQEYFWHITKQSMNFVTNVDLTISYTLTYYCKFFRRQMVADVA